MGVDAGPTPGGSFASNSVTYSFDGCVADVSSAGPQMAVRTPERFKLAVMGRSGVGKTCITIRYTKDRFVLEHDPTIEDMHLRDIMVGCHPVSLAILDTAGKDAYSALRREWMKNGHGFLFVFSLVDRQTFDELGSFREELMDLYPDDPPPSVLVANKADLAKQDWTVSDAEVTGLLVRWKNCMKVVYTSARSGERVQDAFEPLCAAVQERRAVRRQSDLQREEEQRRMELYAADQADCGGRCRLSGCCRRTAPCALQ